MPIRLVQLGLISIVDDSLSDVVDQLRLRNGRNEVSRRVRAWEKLTPVNDIEALG